jgi:hypothetical protein
MLHHVAVVRTDVLEEHIASIIRVTRMLAMLAVTSNQSTLRTNSLMMEVICTSETSVLTRATLRNILQDGVLLFSSLAAKKPEV